MLRHVMLLADLMTCRGEVLGITRHGLAKVNTNRILPHMFSPPFSFQDSPVLGGYGVMMAQHGGSRSVVDMIACKGTVRSVSGRGGGGGGEGGQK